MRTSPLKSKLAGRVIDPVPRARATRDSFRAMTFRPGLAGFFLTSLLLLFIAGCRNSSTTYTLTGRVISKHPETQQLIIDNDDIPGFMPAMTMPYTVKDPGGFEKVQPADVIRALVVVGPDRQFWLEHLEVTGKSAARPAKGASAHNVLYVGDKVPDVDMVNQDGKTIHLSQFQGKLVLFTFVYTRCPFPDFCPLISRQFSAIEKGLAANPAEFQATHLLTISLDPDYDKPPVLREYGLKYIDHNPSGFEHWDFVSTTQADLQALVEEFGLDLSSQDGQVLHSLNTILLARDGTVAEMWPGNEWQVAEVLDVTRHALSLQR